MNPVPVSSSKASFLTPILFIALCWFPLKAENSYSFSFENKPLRDALIHLIHEKNISIIFSDQGVDSTSISAQCDDCTPEEALDIILRSTPLSWKKTGQQFTIYKPRYFQFSLNGIVTDSLTGESVPFANVFIKNNYVGNVTNQNGRFTLVNIPTKVCTLQISYIGYETSYKPLFFPIDESKSILIHLRPKVLTGDHVIIQGDNLEFMDQSSGQGQVAFSPRHISALPYLGETDIFRSLQLLPGIQMGTSGTADLFIRGGTPDQNLILVDGIPIYKPDHFFGFFSAINSDAIKDVQVYKGHIPIKYGGRLSSVISMTGKNGNVNHRELSVFMNILSSGFSYEQPLPLNGSWIISSRNSNSKYIESDLYHSIQQFVTGDDRFNLLGESVMGDETKKTTYSPQFDFFDLNNKISFLPTSSDRISFSFLLGKDQINESRSFIGLSELWTYDSVRTEESTQWENQGMAIHWAHHWNPYFESEFSLSQSNYTSVFSISQLPINPNQSFIIQKSNENNSFHDQTIRMNHHWVINESHQLDFGMENNFYTSTLLTQKQHNDVFINIFNQKEIMGISTSYIQDKWSLSPTNSAIIGLRLNTDHIQDEFKIEPRLSIRSIITPQLKIEASFGKAIQFIHQFQSDLSSRGSEKLWILSNSALQPSEAIFFNIGTQWSTDAYQILFDIYKKGSTELANYYHMNTPAPYQLTRRGILPSSVFIGSGNSSGLELLIHKRKGDIQGWVAYHYGKSTFSFDGLYGGQTYLADHDHTQELKLVAMGKINSWDITLNWIYSSGTVFTSLDQITISDDETIVISDNGKNTSRLSPIHRLDISFTKSYSIGSIPFESGLSIFNVYNRQNISHKRVNPFSPEPTITDVKMLGFSPTVFIKIHF